MLNGLAAGAEPDRLLRDTVAGALVAARADAGGILRLAGGECTPVAVTGRLSAAAIETGRAAVAGGRMVRRRDADTGHMTAAEPLRAGQSLLGALVVTGSADGLEPAALPLFAAAAASVVKRHAAATPEALPELLASLAVVARDLDASAMSARILDAARDLFGVDCSLCALSGDGPVRVSQFRGIDADRMARASMLAGFRALVTGDDVRVDGPDDPVVACLSALGHVAVGLPLTAGGRLLGRLVLLLPEAPGTAGRVVLERFAGQVAVCLLAAQLHRAIGDQEHQLASVAHSVGQPVVMVDDNGNLVEVNGAAAQAFGLAGRFERGQPVAGRLGHTDVERMLTSGDEGTAEVVVGSGDARVYRATVRRVRGADSRVTGRVLVLDDVTTARQTDALKADFVAVIGHELRTPITVMKGYLKALMRRGDAMTPERRAQALTAVDTNVTRLERIIEDLLFVSAIEQRSTQLDLRPVDVCELLRGQAGGRVAVDVPDAAVTAQVDEDRIGQVVRHLLDNALEHSSGEVVARVARRDGKVEVVVEDSGPGIFSGDVPHLFSRFHQLDSSSTRSHGGLGIGLYICRRIIEAMGGRIWCESRLGVGSRFIFTVPAAAVEAPVS
ncbi:MAG: sensor histidine kinase [Acidimicrobiales bacterium]